MHPLGGNLETVCCGRAAVTQSESASGDRVTPETARSKHVIGARNASGAASDAFQATGYASCAEGAACRGLQALDAHKVEPEARQPAAVRHNKLALDFGAFQFEFEEDHVAFLLYSGSLFLPNCPASCVDEFPLRLDLGELEIRSSRF
jgi:hypothetical protein